MDIPTNIASHLADLSRAEKKKTRAANKSNRLARATQRARAKEVRHYEKTAPRLTQSKTRIGNLAQPSRGGLGGLLGRLLK